MASLFRSTLVHIADPVIEKNRPSPKRASLLRLGADLSLCSSWSSLLPNGTRPWRMTLSLSNTW